VNGNGKLDLAEFEEALGAFGLFPKMVDLKAIHKYYDVDGDGNICYNEFVNALSDQKMCKRKTDMVEKAWVAICKPGAQEVTGNEVSEAFKDKENVGKFLDLFPGTKGSKMDGCISVDEFIQYYRELATSVPNDEYFIRAVESQWVGVSEEIDAAVKRDRVMHVVKLMR